MVNQVNQSISVSPLGALATLQVEEQRRDDLVHVLRVPDVCLQFVLHRLPHDALQALNACHADAAGDKDIMRICMCMDTQKLYIFFSHKCMVTFK